LYSYFSCKIVTMNFKDYRLWVVIAVGLTLGAFVIVFSGPSPTSDVPIGAGTGAPPTPSPLDFQGKEDRLRDLLKQDPDNPALLATLGDVYFENNRFAEAAAQYEKALELNPDDVDTYNDLGLAYHYTVRPVLAVETLRKGTEVDPSYQRIWLSLGFVLASRGQVEEAEKALEKAISLNPSSGLGREAQRIKDSIKGTSR
jgi:tetratricopeptide (TPR) repeat protein